MPVRCIFITFLIWVISSISYSESEINSKSIVEDQFDGYVNSLHVLQNDQYISSDVEKPNESQGVITLQRALSLALLQNPELKSFSKEIRAKEAQYLQTGLFPNPELLVEAENFGGENGKQNFDGVETTIWISQLVPLGGKISKKKRVATLEKDLSVWDYESKRLDVLAATARAFIELLSAQEHLYLAGEQKKFAQRVLNTVSARVEAGKGFPTEEINAEVALSSALLELGRWTRTLSAKRRNLAILWGNYGPEFKRAAGSLYTIREIPELDKLTDKLSQNPELARWKHELEMRTAVIKRENADAVPDVTVSFGKRFFAEDNSDAFVMGFEMPLPVFNRNQGSRLEARHRLHKAEKDKETVKLQMLRLLSDSYNDLSTAFMEVRTLRDSVIPNAGRVFDSASEWYRKGKFSYLQVLDAQRTLFQIRNEYINALTEYHHGINNVERLIADKLD